MHLSKDPHSFYEPGQPSIELLCWIFSLDFEAECLHGMVRYTFDRSGRTCLDTRDLEILQVYGTDGNIIPFDLDDPEVLRGSRLSFEVPENLFVMVVYKTNPVAKGIQWMSAEIAGGKPFVYTQGEAINARTYIPCQDTPSVKFTFSSSVTVPKELRGLVAAAEYDGGDVGHNDLIEHWLMPFPITSYLIAFAVGELARLELSDRSAVWAQPHMVHKAAEEFQDLPKLMEAGETLFGPYPFGRYDILVMPDAFPYGGMENPCLSFLTPALVAGDGSGISTVAHELAHSWTGNLVTNANWSSFWLNEGWTVWAEDRIIEAVYGRDAAMLGRKLLEREFFENVMQYEKDGMLRYTALAPDVSDIDPDDVFSRVPYFKGAQLLTLLETLVGREAFDAFALRYIDTYKFQSITTETFLEFLKKELGEQVYIDARVDEWVYEPGYPDNAPDIESSLVREVEEMVDLHFVPALETVWTKPQWQLYLELLPEDESAEFLMCLDGAWGLSSDTNLEVRWSFLVQVVKAGLYEAFADKVEALLRSQGRMKYLKPLYRALAATSEGRVHAERIFNAARGSYHPVAISAVESVLKG